MAGKNSTPRRSSRRSARSGASTSRCSTQYVDDDGARSSRATSSPTPTATNVVDEIKRRRPAHVRARDRRGDHLVRRRRRARPVQRDARGRRSPTASSPCSRSSASRCRCSGSARSRATTWATSAGHLPQRRLRADRRGRALRQWLHHLILPWIVLSTLFIGVYSRVRALERARHDQRRLRAHRAGQGPAASGACMRPPRPAQLAHPGHHAVGPGLRRRARRRRDPHRDRLRHPGRRPVLRRVDQPARRAAGAGGRRCSARSSSSCFNAIVDIVYAALDPRIRLS